MILKILEILILIYSGKISNHDVSISYEGYMEIKPIKP